MTNHTSTTGTTNTSEAGEDYRSSEGLRALLRRLHAAGRGAWEQDPVAGELMAFAAEKYAALAHKHRLDVLITQEHKQRWNSVDEIAHPITNVFNTPFLAKQGYVVKVVDENNTGFAVDEEALSAIGNLANARPLGDWIAELAQNFRGQLSWSTRVRNCQRNRGAD